MNKHALQTSTFSEYTLQVDGITVFVQRKRIKNINLHITQSGAEVKLSAPLWIDDASIAAFIRAKRSWIREKQLALASSPMRYAEHAGPDEVTQWRTVVSACVPALMEEWEGIIGVKHRSLVYRNMKSRWGSCQPETGRICINVRLALYPPECLEYVVVHELCHLKERGHGQRFKVLMDRYMPDWRERQAKLK